MRNTIIDNIRGICMLGVIGIHIGSLALAPNNFTLYCFLEVLSRYSVPAFFFISGYGLCCTDRTLLSGGKLNYLQFMKKRLQGAGLPYFSWSIFYLIYFWLILPPGFISWRPLNVAFVLFFGLACYHLYFMVILLWFYALYPLWRTLLRGIMRYSIPAGLVLLFAFQLGFNWWTTHPGLDVSQWNVLWKNFFNYRLNYLPLHYLLIFMSGCLAAVHWDKLLGLLRKYAPGVIALYALSIAWFVGSSYHAFTYENYSLLDIANTYHQLSPQGLVYTVCSLLFFCLALDWLERKSQNADTSLILRKLQAAITVLSANSMLIYFIHPLILDWLSSLYNYFGIIMTVKKVCFSYVLLVVGSLLLSMILNKLFARNKYLSLCFIGKAHKK